MAEKKKPSGAFYRKRKADIEKEDQKQAKLLSKFICKSESATSTASVSAESECSGESRDTEQHQLQVRINLFTSI